VEPSTEPLTGPRSPEEGHRRAHLTPPAPGPRSPQDGRGTPTGPPPGVPDARRLGIEQTSIPIEQGRTARNSTNGLTKRPISATPCDLLLSPGCTAPNRCRTSDRPAPPVPGRPQQARTYVPEGSGLQVRPQPRLFGRRPSRHRHDLRQLVEERADRYLGLLSRRVATITSDNEPYPTYSVRDVPRKLDPGHPGLVESTQVRWQQSPRSGEEE
jgi:hypothetical protein